ncbi:glyoxalase-like protein [Arthrobacter sp. SLBN-100]|uniref:VOC family protein n=1 Tax=Arthrobacter sp. SLBN-100 TaxID=2768450 RepID=UPI0011536EA1|nr:VOC family protein [Arthrobacter sp. SLBN-100]TQJ67036.1 glyoxalase-like protein [Arthrobacter sp. SLBN-100]
MDARIDHLVIAADSLEQGAAWCAATFGVEPSGGGKHPLMGTHNRVIAISSESFPDCYLEVIAIDPGAPAPGRPRWFGLDHPEVRAAVRESPRLVHAVARTCRIEMLHRDLASFALNPGELRAAQRDTPHGLLKWRITIRDDGRTECAGALPSLIEWEGQHPCANMPPSDVSLRSLVLRGVPSRAVDVLKLPAVHAGPIDGVQNAPLTATVESPGGRVVLDAWHFGAEPR